MKMIKLSEDHYIVVDNKEMHTIPTSEAKELIGVVDAEKKGEKKYPKSEFWVGSNPSRLYDENAKERRCYIEGYNQALEDNKEKKYTDTDMVHAYKMGLMRLSDHRLKHYMLPKTEWEVEMVDGKLKLKS